MYALLLAYSDFAGCSRIVSNVGSAPQRFADVEQSLAAAWRRLEVAVTLFTRSASRSDPQGLLAASREALAASPRVDRAQFALAKATRRPAR